jgi:hypothetical protein
VLSMVLSTRAAVQRAACRCAHSYLLQAALAYRRHRHGATTQTTWQTTHELRTDPIRTSSAAVEVR